MFNIRRRKQLVDTDLDCTHHSETVEETAKATPHPPPVTVVVKGAATEIGRILTLMVSNGEVFGLDTPLDVYLVETKVNLNHLRKGTYKELQMCNLTLVRHMTCTDDLELAVAKADYIFFVNGVQPNPHLSRRDILSSNALEYKNIGLVLDKVRNPTTKLLFIAEPQNINMAICCHFAPTINPKNVTALSRVDHNRAMAKLTKILGISAADVSHLCVWGNCGSNSFPDIRHAHVVTNGKKIAAYDAVGNDYYLKYDFVHEVLSRSEEIFQKRNSGPSLTMANAAVQHMRDWICGTPPDDFTSMIVISDGSYGIPEGLPYSFPVRVSPSGQWEIVNNLELDLFEKERLEEAKESVVEEKLFVDTVLGVVELRIDEEGQPPPWSFGAGKVVPCRLLGAVERERMLLF